MRKVGTTAVGLQVPGFHLWLFILQGTLPLQCVLCLSVCCVCDCKLLFSVISHCSGLQLLKTTTPIMS